MRRLALWAAFAPILVLAQTHWQGAGMPYSTHGIRELYSDSVAGRLIAMGLVAETGTFPIILPYYRNGVWDQEATFNGSMYTCTRFGDTLVVGGGGLTDVSGVPVTAAAAFYDGQWHAFGSFVGDCVVRKLKVIDGELYAVGGFGQVDGHLCNGIAKRQDGQWVNVGDLEDISSSDPILVDVIKFQGELYACGVISLAPNGEHGIIKFDGTTWSAPGGGILGGVAAGRAMAVYNDELYVGGSIYLDAGNAGHMIMRWNGSAWNSVGGNLRDQDNSTAGAARCYALLPYEGKLLAAGGFQYAGGVPAQTFAIWDGVRWCGTGDSLNNESESLTIFQDTLYMACGYVVNGDSVNRIVKWVSGPVEGDSCAIPMGMADEISSAALQVYPNPGGNALGVSGISPQGVKLRMLDLLGREVLSPRLVKPQECIRTDRLPSGTYLVVATDPNGASRTLRWIKQ